MAIGEKLEYLNDTKTAIKGALQNRGVTVSDTDTFRSYADKVGQIGETVEKTKFGASVDTFIGDIDENGVLKKSTWKGALNFVGVKTAYLNSMSYAFYGHTGITSVDLSSLQSIDNNGMVNTFSFCRGITSVDLSSLQSIGSSGMGNTFRNCTTITSVDLSSLQSIGSDGMSNAFNGCTGLTTISFPSLTSVNTSSFGSATYSSAFADCSALTEIHFRADMQATIEAMSQYENKWGAASSTIYFDL